MAAFMDKFKNMIGIPTDDYYEEDEDMPIITREDSRISEVKTNSKYNQVVNINTTTQVKVVLVKPEKYDDAPAIADHLNANHTVVLNLEATTSDITRRLLDFLGGVAYANKGKVKRVSKRTFIITPDSVDIMGDLLDELESSGVFY